MDTSQSRYNSWPSVATQTLLRNANRCSSMVFPGPNQDMISHPLAAYLMNAKNKVGSFEVVFSLIDLPAVTAPLAGLMGMVTAAPAGYVDLYITPAGDLGFRLNYNAITLWTMITTSTPVVPGVVYHLVVTQDGTGPKMYLNGKRMTVTLVSTDLTGWLDDLQPAGGNKEMFIGSLKGANYLRGEIYRLRAFNRALSTDDIWALMVSELSYGDIGAQTVEHLTPAVPGNWVGAGDITTGIAEASLIGYLFTVAGVSTSTQSNATLVRDVQPNKRYRFTYTVTETVAFDGTLAFDLLIGWSQTVSLLTTAGTHSVEFVADSNSITADVVFQITSGGGATLGTYTIGNLRLIQVGCVASYEQDTIMTNSYWGDKSNELNGAALDFRMLNGANRTIVKNPPETLTQRFRAISTDTTFTAMFPGGYVMDKIIVDNTTANAIAGIDIDSGGTSIVAAEAIGANATVDCTLVTTLLGTDPNTSYDLTVIDTGGAGWNNGVIDITIIARKFN